MEKATAVVCICETHEQSERAINNLQTSGCDMSLLSVATRDRPSDRHEAGYYRTGEETFNIPGIATSW